MSEPAGLRERKKQRTREAIAAAAIALFLERGFDQVSVADVAAAAEVSKRTLFKYFPSKEDLVVQRFADHQDESARHVRAREPGESPLSALHRGWLDALRRQDPISGLCDEPEVVRFYQLITGTESLTARLRRFAEQSEAMLVAALTEAGYPPRRAQFVAVQFGALEVMLMGENSRAIASGRSAAEVYPEAVAALAEAIDLLRHGAESGN
ncbi:TetR family transcriptional regulator [Crossiella sp. CA-258035]|uniref:TetR family transcriptional regulator n=1 Tax=Crossiella sp. CA-258035 TaxID=2981138 RepID=UPI0024BC7BB0|nr:TetR family transcriptional regulator [Crossiella sp. CA-258035]WHT22934.1 TetR family transcriptional regulator [Crossiella sp. CA-258035]